MTEERKTESKRFYEIYDHRDKQNVTTDEFLEILQQECPNTYSDIQSSAVQKYIGDIYWDDDEDVPDQKEQQQEEFHQLMIKKGKMISRTDEIDEPINALFFIVNGTEVHRIAQYVLDARFDPKKRDKNLRWASVNIENYISPIHFIPKSKYGVEIEELPHSIQCVSCRSNNKKRRKVSNNQQLPPSVGLRMFSYTTPTEKWSLDLCGGCLMAFVSSSTQQIVFNK